MDSGELPVNSTLRSLVLLLRVMGWAWMMLLIALTPGSDPGANRVVLVAAAALVTVWTAVTVWAARTGFLRTRWFAASDLAVALAAGSASTIAGAENLFHGGYLISALGVSAYCFGFAGTLVAALALTIDQVVVHIVDGRDLVPLAGSIIFLFVAVILGWGFAELRSQQAHRLAAEAQLARVRGGEIRREERLELANRLHDSVLQTLTALRRNADDPAEVRYLARRQERDLRRTISAYRAEFDPSSRAQLEAVCDEVEDTYQIEVDAVIRGDALLTEKHAALIAAAREALINAAKHADVPRVNVYAELASGAMQVYVRDRGIGFDPTGQIPRGGLEHGLHVPLEAIGGRVAINSVPNGGTEVALSWASA